MKKFKYVLLLINSPFIFAQKPPQKLLGNFIESRKLVDNKNFDEAKKRYNIIIDIGKKKKYYNLVSLSYNNLGNIYETKGAYKEAKIFYETGIEYGEKSKEKSGFALNKGSLGKLLSETKLNINIESQYIKEGISILEKNDVDDVFHDLALGNLYTWLQSSKTVNKPRNLQLDYANKALFYYNRAPAKLFNKDILYAVSYYNIALAESDLKHFDNSIRYLNKANAYNKNNSKQISILIYSGFTKNYREKKLYDSVIYYGYKGLSYINNEDKEENDEALEGIYSDLVDAYWNTKRVNLAYDYTSILQNSKRNSNEKKIDFVIDEYKNNVKTSIFLNKINGLILFISVILVLLLLILIFYFFLKYKQEVRIFSEFRRVREMQREKKELEISQKKVNYSGNITGTTELNILIGLEKFENELLFKQRGITLGNLANELQTNVRYLSYIIKKHKSESFNSYINNLRIQYVLNKLDAEPIYREYKISYIAEDSGFSTPAIFSRIFKNSTGLSPSSYVILLKRRKTDIK